MTFVRAFRTSVVSRFVALVLVVATGSTQSIASWHEAGVEHVRCAEHGELVHTSAVHRHGRAGVEVDVRSMLSLLPEENPGGPESDDHCEIALIVQGSVASPVLLDSVPFAHPIIPGALALSTVMPPGRAVVLASAPKTSPPAV